MYNSLKEREIPAYLFFANQADFRLQFNTMRFLDALLHFTDEVQYIRCGGAAFVHHKARMLGGNLRAAHRQALKPRLVDNPRDA